MENSNTPADAADKHQQSGQQQQQEALNKKIHAIFPYFKQLLAPDNRSASEPLPEDLTTIEQQKHYAVNGINLIIRNICDDLNCLYVYDTEEGLELIQEHEINKLNINRDQLHEIAMSNYRQLVAQQLNAQNNGEAFWFILDGNYEAGLILIDEIWDQIEGYLQEEIVLCVPSRDVIFATGKSNEQVITDFTEKAQQILTVGNHALSKNWFIRQNKQWNVFRKIMD